ncbi:hypothetical protein chiPu_0017590 [Chiloscyllium punctatum]|uniref:Uncharacterized protein n=1 Tax=Chiloscyllium punctatum TaxID=137246 RepID=A0A401RHD0_CHIPU|nr:hypothetical protein [Chiloscyllium punctatum]
MVELWRRCIQQSPKQRHMDTTEAEFEIPQNKEGSNSCALCQSIAKANEVPLDVKEHLMTIKEEQIYSLHTARQVVTAKHDHLKRDHKVKEDPDSGGFEEVKMRLANWKRGDFTLMKETSKVQAKICGTDANSEGFSEPIILICQIATDFSGSVSAESDADSLSTRSSSPIFLNDQDLSLWSTLWDPPLTSEPLRQMALDAESLHRMSNETANCQFKLINRLETWQTGVKKMLRSQFHQLTQRVKPKIKSPEQFNREEEGIRCEEYKLEDGFSDIPLG